MVGLKIIILERYICNYCYVHKSIVLWQVLRRLHNSISGGAGGKGTWGAIGEVLNEEDLKIRDQHDPNYESEEDEDVRATPE